MQFFQTLIQNIYNFFTSLFVIFNGEFSWMLKKRTKQTNIIPPQLAQEIVSTLNKEICYAKMMEREQRSSIKSSNFCLDEFLSKYILIPKPLRLTLLYKSCEKYKESNPNRRLSKSFNNLSLILISLLQDYEEFIVKEDLEYLKQDLFKFLGIHRSRIFNYLLDHLMKLFLENNVKINPQELQHTRLIWQIKNEVAYRPFMVKYYEHQESFNKHIETKEDGLIKEEYQLEGYGVVTRYTDDHGLTHRNNGPAVEIKRDIGVYKEWKYHGMFHRVDGPAIIFENGDEEWYIFGRKHRDDGPAVIYESGKIQRWVYNGIKHRLNGPATVYYDEKRYYINSINYSKNQYYTILRIIKKFIKKIQVRLTKKLTDKYYNAGFNRDVASIIASYNIYM